ncbi:MAG: ABC transporter permease [Nitrospira sp.]|nr:ABC transporter permease [Nitrospira sp.]
MWWSVWGSRSPDSLMLGSGVLILVISIVAILAPWLAPYPYNAQDNTALLQSPSSQHWMGTDRLGRDLFSRLLYGTRISMSIGILTALAALVLGTLYGAISGYLGGRVDNWMMRWVDIVYALPDLLLIILIMVIVGRGLGGIFLALTLVSWVTVARIIRGEVLKYREQSYVEAARALGAGHLRILFRHILPNTFGPLIVILTFRIPAAILAESTLSFVGLGISPPLASWGTLANEGWAAMKFYPHLILFPGLFIFIAILAFNFFGDGLRDILDPQSRPATR